MLYNYITQAEFQADHPATDLSQFSAATISGMISAASQYVDNFCNVNSFAVADVVSEKARTIVSAEGDLLIFPRKVPINSITSINLHRGTFNLSLTLNNGSNNIYEIPTSGDMILYPNTYLTAVGTFTITDLRLLRTRSLFTILTYNAGYAVGSIPDPIKKATMLLVRDLVNKRLNAAGASQVTQGGITIKYANRDDGKSDDVQDAERLLGPYRRVVPI